ICCLVPGVKGVSENIRVISIIGKYLEHARVFYFKHSQTQMFISSADWMPRNLVRRIELMTGIEDEEAKEKLLQLLTLQLSDNVLAHELQSDGNYRTIDHEDGAINSQQLLEQHTNKLYKSTKKRNANYVNKLASRLFKES
ncbi:MAG: RNA degradosome polyphosphate kinase, partial [Campylobacterales bacterium]